MTKTPQTPQNATIFAILVSPVPKFDIILVLVYHISMDFQRKQKIEEAITPKRVLLIYGPRRVGKTTLLKKYIKVAKGSVLYTTGDDIDIRRIYESEQRTKILSFVESYDVIGIDEAQEIPKVGLGTKMIIDEYPEKNIILTGSSSFGLSQEVGAPLTEGILKC